MFSKNTIKKKSRRISSKLFYSFNQAAKGNIECNTFNNTVQVKFPEGHYDQVLWKNRAKVDGNDS